MHLRGADGAWVPVALDQDGKWQVHGVALLDFEDGTASCKDTGNAALNDSVHGSVQAGEWDGVRFDLGVPFALNHNDSATAPAPLDVTPMFWVWQTGYKFLRIDVLNGTPAPDNRWNIHVGSTGCASDAKTTPPTEPCAKPNRATVELTGFDPTKEPVVADIAALLDGVDVTAETPETSPGCMSTPGDAAQARGPLASTSDGVRWGAETEARAGAAFVVVPELLGCSLDAAWRWSAPDVAVQVDDGEQADGGSDVLALRPGVQVRIAPGLEAWTAASIPVYERVGGVQLVETFSVSFGLVLGLGLGGDEPPAGGCAPDGCDDGYPAGEGT